MKKTISLLIAALVLFPAMVHGQTIVPQGGTGLISVPNTYVLMGSSSPSKLQAVSTTTLYSMLNISAGSPNYLVLQAGGLATATSTDFMKASYFIATSTTATSTFAAPVQSPLLVLNQNAAPGYVRGGLYYDTTNESLTFYNNDSNVALQVGQEEWIKVVNNTGSTIANGSAVYISGSSAGVPTIALAKADVASTTVVAGLTTQSISNGATGYVTSIGLVRDLNTSGFTTGNVFLSSTTAGALTQTVPQSPFYRYRVGFVTSVNATTGTIHVTPSTASVGNGSIGQVLTINASSSQAWVATSTLGFPTAAQTNYWTLGNGFLRPATTTDLIGIGTTTPYHSLDIRGRGGFMPIRISSSTGAVLFEIEQNGNVGIGTTTAGSALTVQGGIFAQDSVSTASTTATSNFKGIFSVNNIVGATRGLFMNPNTGVTIVGGDTDQFQIRDTDDRPLAVFSGNKGLSNAMITLGFDTAGFGDPAVQFILSKPNRTFTFSNGSVLVGTTSNRALVFAASASTTLTTLAAQATTSQSANVLDVWGSTGSSLFNVAPNGSTTVSNLNAANCAVFSASGSLYCGISGSGTSSPNYLVLQNGGLAAATSTDFIKAAYFIATSTTATSTFAGSFAVGTTTPRAPFQVNVGTNGTSDLRFSCGVGCVTPTIAIANNGTLGKATGFGAGTSGAYSFFDSAGSLFFLAESRANINANMTGAGTSTMQINGTTGNVGIGPFSGTPGSRLTVQTSGQDTLAALGGNGAKMALLNDMGLYGTLFGTLATGNGYIQQQRVDGTATAYNLLLQPNAGNVGIGNSAPVTLLDVGTGYSTSLATIKTGAFYLQPYALNNEFLSENMYFNGGAWVKPNAGFASGFQFYNGQVAFLTGATGAAGSFSPKYAFKVDDDSSLGTVCLGGDIDVTPGSCTGAVAAVKGSGGMRITSKTGSDGATAQQWEYGTLGGAGLGNSYNLKLKQVVTSGVVRWTFDQVNNDLNYANVFTLDRGSVGIGSTTPIATLAVVGTTTSDMFAVASSSGSSALIVKSNGNVGIGSSTPNYRLVVGSGQVVIPDGSAANPSLSFAGGPTDGLYRLGSGIVTSVGGTAKMLVGSNAIYSVMAGTQNFPAFSYNSDTDTGMWFPSANNLGFTVGNTDIVRITSTGLGIGTTTPAGALGVNGTVYLAGLTTSGTGNALCITTANQVTNAGGAACVPSSIFFKKNVIDLPKGKALDILARLRSVEFDYKDAAPGETNHSYGVIAEEVEKIDRNLVDYKDDGTVFGVHFEKITGLQIQAINELREKIDAIDPSGARKAVQDHWQWMAICLLAGFVIRQQIQIKRIINN